MAPWIGVKGVSKWPRKGLTDVSPIASDRITQHVCMKQFKRATNATRTALVKPNRVGVGRREIPLHQDSPFRVLRRTGQRTMQGIG